MTATVILGSDEPEAVLSYKEQFGIRFATAALFSSLQFNSSFVAVISAI
jgi:hypothetical protein